MDMTIEQLTELLDKRDEKLFAEMRAILTKPKSIRISQKEAYEIYGRANVKAWRLSGQLQAYKMLRKVEYEVAALDELMKQKQLIMRHKKSVRKP